MCLPSREDVDWSLFSFPGYSYGCALSSHLGAVTHTRPPAHSRSGEGEKKKKVIFIQSSCFSWCPHSSRWLFFKKIDHRTSQTEAKPVFADCKNKIRLHFRRSSYLLTAVHTQRECWAIQLHFPATRQKFKQKKKPGCEVCAVQIINDPEWGWAVITDCGVSQDSQWKHGIFPVILCRVSAWPKPNKKKKKTGSFSGRVEP